MRVALGDFRHVWTIPLHVAEALVRVAHIAVRKRQHLGPFAGERPLGLGTHALADGGALHLRLVEAVHDLGARALFVGPGVGVHAVPLVHLLALAARFWLELFAHRFLVRLV